MTAGDAPTSAPPPRAISWRMVLARHAPLGWLGTALVAGGLLWLALRGGSASANQGPDRAFGALILPGLVCLGIWLRLAARDRLILVHGTATPARLVTWERPVLRSGFYAECSYRDDRNLEHTLRTYLPPASEEFTRVEGGGLGLVVVYDPARPESGRVVAAPGS